MHQSPDDIFAAHFWTWPDPALKRDAHGRVLFVNAAFLQLFGGQVEDWRGQTIGGWQPPQPGPAPARFEIRTPAMPGMPEQIYDWMELAGPDGSAFALARNVTAFAVPATPPDAPDVQPQPSAVRQPLDAAPVFDETTFLPHGQAEAPVAPPPFAQQVEPAAVPPVVDTTPAPVAEPAAAPAPAVLSAEPEIAAPALDVPELHVPALDVPTITAEPAPLAVPVEAPAPVAPPLPIAAPSIPAEHEAPVAATVPDPVLAPAAVAASEPERDFERRALPIENDEAVLGNNWRDAVIAKAVGVPDAAAADPAPESGHAPSAPAGGTKDGTIRILLAEDNAINALLTRTLLEAEGHTVETVEDGALAVEAMKTSNFDLIFMDMRMPNMDGLESTRKIRALPNVPKELPIIALTANAFDDDRNACFDSGMNDFMTKPVSAEELSEMVTRWTGAEAETALAS